jgi:hypothetical protein
MTSEPEEAEAEEPKRKYRWFGGQDKRLAAYIKRAKLEASQKNAPTAEVFDPEKDDPSSGYRKLI